MLSIPPGVGQRRLGRRSKFADGIEERTPQASSCLCLGSTTKALASGRRQRNERSDKIQNYRQLGIDVNAKWKCRKLGTAPRPN